jgi:hypothetical protein
MLFNGEMAFGGITLYEEVGGAWVPRMAADWLDANNGRRPSSQGRGSTSSLFVRRHGTPGLIAVGQVVDSTDLMNGFACPPWPHRYRLLKEPTDDPL